VLVARGLSVVRAGRAIVDAVDVSATAGEFIGVVGPNGAGKSTLLAALAGLLAPDAGTVECAGRPLAQVPAAVLARERAYLPQHPRCDWPLAVERVIALGLPPGIDAGSGDAAVAVQLDALGLHGLRGRAVTTLSGGELCRVMLARALVGRPGLLIVDEPLAGLDPRHALEVVALLRGLARSQGCLVVAALHDLSVVARHCTRLWALRDGRLVADRPAAALDAALVAQLFDVQATVAADGRVDFG
jgi:iron complex transport system ATP-binding protein